VTIAIPPSNELLHAYGRVLRLGDLMWQHHFEFLLLGYGAYATFADFCKGQLPDIPDQHIAQMVAGIDVLLFRPDAELRRLAQLAASAGRKDPTHPENVYGLAGQRVYIPSRAASRSARSGSP